MANTNEARAVDDAQAERQFELDAAKVRTLTAESIATTAAHLLFLCKELTGHSHGRQQLRDAAELTIEATGFARSAEQVKAAALARLSALGGR